MSHRSKELFGQDGQQLTSRSAGCEFALHALTAALQTAFEAAVFPDWFEIDEQGPISRIDALTETLILQLRDLARDSSCDEESIAVLNIIQRIGAHMGSLPKGSKKSTKSCTGNNLMGNW